MSRKKGESLEKQVSKDLGINLTTNSGAKWDNGDLANQHIIIECKVKDQKRLSACGADVEKLQKQAKKRCTDWAYIQRNQSGTFVVLDYEYFKILFGNR